MPLKRAVDIALDMAKALTDLHEGGVSVQDLNPQNVQLSPKGQALLSEFGQSQVEEWQRSLLSNVSIHYELPEFYSLIIFDFIALPSSSRQYTQP